MSPDSNSRNQDVDRSSLEFICIGAQKAGTTWLYEMLRRHPEVWMPQVKELHYFDRSPTYSSDNFLAEDRPLRRVLGSEPHNREFRRKWLRLLARTAKHPSFASLTWSLRFGLGVLNDEWYRSLFAAAPAPVRGEITPSYMMLNQEDVARVHELAPKLKVLLLMRNPVDRAWSQIRHDWGRGVFKGIDDFDQVCQFVDSPHQALRSDYLRTLRIWESYFPKDQIFVAFFDDISEQPLVFLQSFLTFLGVDSGRGVNSMEVHKKIFASKGKKMPVAVGRYLAEKYHQDIITLAARFGSHANRWRCAVEAAL